MENQIESCESKRKKRKINLAHESSESPLSSDTDSVISSFKLLTGKNPKISTWVSRKDGYLSSLFEKKKLKEKSLSKTMKTPLDRKLNRTCWPIKLNKITKIKKRPIEKRKKKPNNRSLKKRKISNPNFSSRIDQQTRSASDSESATLDDDSFGELLENLNENHFIYKPITPQMLIDVLKDPEHLKSGATVEMIIGKLKRRGNINLRKTLSPKTPVKSTLRSKR